MTLLQPLTEPLTDQAADALVLGLRGGSTPEVAGAHALPADTAAYLADAVSTLGLKGQPDEVTRLVAVPGVAAATVVLSGLGTSGDGYGTGPGDGTGSESGAEALRRAAGAALRSVVGRATSVVVSLPVTSASAVRAVGEGAYAGCYRYAGRASGEGVTSVLVDTSEVPDAADALTRAEAVGRARTLAMDLTNTPPNLLTPPLFVDRVRELVAATADAPVELEVMTEVELAQAGCGGILGVGQGSAAPPRMVRLSYTPAGASAHVALVGKGITFDTGGLRLKPITGMLHMKTDMEGAAVVAGAFFAAVDLALPVRVTAYLALAENMVDGNSQRPSDVVTMHNGMTVEVLDPDAEGRMVLADGMSLAGELAPDVLLDIATLTGMQAIGLGQRVAGLLGNDERFRATMRSLGQEAGEAMWEIPLVEDYRASLETPVADIAHKAAAEGGMITAALFLREFVTPGTPWAHIDMAGPGRTDRAYGHTPKGATGFGVGTLVRLLESYAG